MHLHYVCSVTSVHKGLHPQHVTFQKGMFSYPYIHIHTHTHTNQSLLLSPGGYTPRSSLPSFIRRTLIFSLMSVPCRSGQKQSSAGAITTSRGIPQNTLCLTHAHKCSGAPSFRDGASPRHTKMSEQTNRSASLRGLIKVSPQNECKNPKSTKLLVVLKSTLVKSAVPVSRR